MRATVSGTELKAAAYAGTYVVRVTEKMTVGKSIIDARLCLKK